MAKAKSSKESTPKVDYPLHDGRKCPQCGTDLCPGLDIQGCFACKAYFLTPYGKEYYAGKGKQATGKLPEMRLVHHEMENLE